MSFGTALTPTLFFDTFSTFPMRKEMSELLPVSDLKAFLAPRVVMLFCVRSKWIICVLFLTTLMRFSTP